MVAWLPSLPPSPHGLPPLCPISNLLLPFSYQDTCLHSGQSHSEILNLITPAKSLFQKKGYVHRFWGLDCGHTFLGATVQPITGGSGGSPQDRQTPGGSCTPEILYSLCPWQRLARSWV